MYFIYITDEPHVENNYGLDVKKRPIYGNLDYIQLEDFELSIFCDYVYRNTNYSQDVISVEAIKNYLHKYCYMVLCQDYNIRILSKSYEGKILEHHDCGFITDRNNNEQYEYDSFEYFQRVILFINKLRRFTEKQQIDICYLFNNKSFV